MDKHIEKRPWGGFEQFCKDKPCTVKILNVNKQSALSLQYHNNRDEFWKIINGFGTIQIGEKIINVKEGEEYFIPRLVKHRAITNDSTLRILEISFGLFDETDIVRLEDKYNRTTSP